MARVVAIALAMLAFGGSAQAGCKIERYRFFFGSDTSTTGVVTGGSTCTSKPGAGSGSGFTSIAITKPASHGKAATDGSVIYPEFTYRPSPGYKGPDDFTVTIEGAGKRYQGASNIHVTMDVQ